MAADTDDQGIPSALRPRRGWAKAARNPEAIHGNFDPATIQSTGYMDPSYTPPKGPSQAPSDAGELEISPYKEAQQGHRLSRTSSPRAGATRDFDGASSPAGGASTPPLADGRPAWDSRFHLNAGVWEGEPRTLLLRPPSSSAFPGASSGGNYQRNCSSAAAADGQGVRGTSGFSDVMLSPSTRRLSTIGGGGGGEDGIGMGGIGGFGGQPHPAMGIPDGYGTRTTVLPGLNATSPTIFPSPYQSAASASNAVIAPSPKAAKGSPISSRPSHTVLVDSYVGQAYSPGRGGGRDSGSGEGSLRSSSQDPAAAAAMGPTDGADADDEAGGMDGHGIHLPALERVYYRKPAAAAADAGRGGGLGAEPSGRSGVSGSPGRGRSNGRSFPGSVYLPRGKELPEPKKVTTGPSGLTSNLYCSIGRGGDGVGAGGGAGGGLGAEHSRESVVAGIGGVWRPSGRQPIPETVPPVPRNKPYKGQKDGTSGDEQAETQEEADKRRAVPRDASIYSPDRYPLVGQGWFLPPEKFLPNPAYAGVRAKYLEPRLPRQVPHSDGDNKHHMPDIHVKPWLNAGKHLITDSSSPPPRMTGTAGARPTYSFSPAATVNSGGMGGTLRSNRGTGRSGKGKKKRGSSSGSGEEEVEGNDEVLAVISGVRLMSIVKRREMADEARMEAEEDREEAARASSATAAAGERPARRRASADDADADAGADQDDGPKEEAEREDEDGEAGAAAAPRRQREGAREAEEEDDAGEAAAPGPKEPEPEPPRQRRPSSAYSSSSSAASGDRGGGGGEAEKEESAGGGLGGDSRRSSRSSRGSAREAVGGDEEEGGDGLTGAAAAAVAIASLGLAAAAATKQEEEEEEEEERESEEKEGEEEGTAGRREEKEDEEEVQPEPERPVVSAGSMDQVAAAVGGFGGNDAGKEAEGDGDDEALGGLEAAADDEDDDDLGAGDLEGAGEDGDGDDEELAAAAVPGVDAGDDVGSDGGDLEEAAAGLGGQVDDD